MTKPFYALWLAVVACVTIAANIANAAPEPMELGEVQGAFVSDDVEFMIEPDERLTVADLVQGKYADRWRQADDELNFGYTTDAYWYRLRVKNRGVRTLYRLLEVDYPLLDYVEFYNVSGGKVEASVITGDQRPYSSRALDVRTFVFPVEVEVDAVNELYLRVKTSGSQQLPLMLWSQGEFIRNNEEETVYRSIFYGMLIIVVLFNAFMYAMVREISYLWYTITCTTLLVVMTSMYGVAFQVFYPEQPALNERVSLISTAAITMFLSFFAKTFFGLEMSRGFSKWLLRTLMIVTTANVVLSVILPYGFSTRISASLAVGASLAIMSLGLVQLFKGKRGSYFFIMGWGCLFVGSTIWLLNLAGVIDASFLTRHGIELGAVGQSLFLTFALVYRFNQEREQRVDEEQKKFFAIAEREKVEADLLYEANHHSVSRLPTRRLLENALRYAIRIVDSGSRSQVALIILSFRGLDDINKTLGHENADRFLKNLGKRANLAVLNLPNRMLIEGGAVESNALAHVEGVSFGCAVFIENENQLKFTIQELIDAICLPMEFKGLRLDVRMGGGCAIYPSISKNVRSLLRHALVASDQSDMGSNDIAIYREAMNPYSERRLTLMTDLRSAIERDELDLHFQPQVSAETGKVCAFEVLLRWTHREHGFLRPDEFIGMAEQTGLIRPLTKWVIEQTIRAAQKLKDEGIIARMSVNISALNLTESNFVDSVRKLLSKYGMSPSLITLEVTESATMENPERSMETLAELHRAGVRVAIDDFGTGYSSLAYLKTLPVDEVKIDKSFVLELGDDGLGDQTILQATVSMCKGLGYEVVAEGIENAKMQSVVEDMGCNLLQGFHIARPMPLETLTAWMHHRKQREHLTGHF